MKHTKAEVIEILDNNSWLAFNGKYDDWLEYVAEKIVGAKSIPRSTITEDMVDKLSTEYSQGHYTDPESIKQAYDDYYTGFEDAIKELKS